MGELDVLLSLCFQGLYFEADDSVLGVVIRVIGWSVLRGQAGSGL
jgi:hypothetical protein